MNRIFAIHSPKAPIHHHNITHIAQAMRIGNFKFFQNETNEFIMGANANNLLDLGDYIIAHDGVYQDISALFAQHGLNFMSAIQGKFSVIIYHKPSSEFMLCRDSHGLSPLYIGQARYDTTIIASELKAITSHYLWRTHCDYENLLANIKLDKENYPLDFFHKINEITIASLQIYNKSGTQYLRKPIQIKDSLQSPPQDSVKLSQILLAPAQDFMKIWHLGELCTFIVEEPIRHILIWDFFLKIKNINHERILYDIDFDDNILMRQLEKITAFHGKNLIITNENLPFNHDKYADMIKHEQQKIQDWLELMTKQISKEQLPDYHLKQIPQLLDKWQYNDANSQNKYAFFAHFLLLLKNNSFSPVSFNYDFIKFYQEVNNEQR